MHRPANLHMHVQLTHRTVHSYKILQTPWVQNSICNLFLSFPPPIFLHAAITLLCNFQDYQQFLKETFFTTFAGLLCQRSNRARSSKPRCQMPVRDLKLNFKILHLIISNFFPPAVTQTIFFFSRV